MSTPLYSIPGTTTAAATPAAPSSPPPGPLAVANDARTVSEVLAQTQAGAVIEELDRDLVGLSSVKARIRDIAALLVIDRLRMNLGLAASAPSLHMSFTGNPGTG